MRSQVVGPPRPMQWRRVKRRSPQPVRAQSEAVAPCAGASWCFDPAGCRSDPARGRPQTETATSPEPTATQWRKLSSFLPQPSGSLREWASCTDFGARFPHGRSPRPSPRLALPSHRATAWDVAATAAANPMSARRRLSIVVRWGHSVCPVGNLVLPYLPIPSRFESFGIASASVLDA